MQKSDRHHLFFVAVLAAVVAGSVLFAQTRASAPAQAKPAAPGAAAGHVTTPKEALGHNVGDDYFLANYTQLTAYWHQLEKDSPNIHVQSIGKTAEGRDQWMAVITSPENYKNLAHYREISARLSNAEGLTDAQAAALAKEGKAVVWIDGGLHASETLGAQQMLETVYQLVSRNDAETERFRSDVIVLVVPANPDGMELVSNWYMQHGSMNVPRLWNHYAGHDDNRDSFMNALPETTNVSKVMYREWYPQIMYNHHQAGPAGAVMFAPPFRDPFNYNFHPEIPADIDLIGAIIATRAIAEGKPGVVNRKGQDYSTWWNGGYRTTAYFHNQIGILTETIGSPDPSSVPFTTRFSIGDSSDWYPITPQAVWHFRQSIDYSVTANKAVIDFASRFREQLLYRMYEMARDEIKWGSEDHWTFTPHKTAAICAEVHKDNAGLLASCSQIAGGGGDSALPNNGRATGPAGRGGGGGGRGGGSDMALYNALTTKALRDPRGYIMSSAQPDFGNAVDFVNALIKSGVEVMKATAPFTVEGKQYPANSLVIKTAQAFRPQVVDMFEPQDYPDDFDNGVPVPPYDDAGWTLAYQMGVQFDRILDGFDGPFTKLTNFAKVPAGTVKGGGTPVGYYFSHENTHSFVAINRLLAAGEDVSWLATGPLGAGTFYVAARPTTLPIIEKAANDLGVSFDATTTAPTGAMSHLHKLRIGLVDSANGGMPVGWTRLIFKDFEFPYTDGSINGSVNDIYGPDINAGNLNAKFDVLVFNNVAVEGGGGGFGGRGGGGGAQAIGGGAAGRGVAAGRGAAAGAAGAAAGAGAAVQGGRGGRGGRGNVNGPAPEGDTRPRPFEPIPEIYTKRQGAIDAQGEAALTQFVENGGTVIVVGNAADSAAQLFKLPITRRATGSRSDFYSPGSIFQIALDPTNPLANGYGDKTDIFFNNNVVWDVNPSPAAGAPAVHTVGWFASDTPLVSGWAWGQKVLNKSAEIVSADVGKGHVFLFGNELTNRSQPHGDFKLFFNALYLSTATK